tara:strand:+ start:552 stop:926 length:375 start_codon:yes stop_codon:yes gene_type:complete
MFKEEIERMPYNNKYTPKLLKDHVESGKLGLLKIIHNDKILAGYVIRINIYPTNKKLLEILFVFGKGLSFKLGKQIFKQLEKLAKKLRLHGIELTGRLEWNMIADRLGFNKQQQFTQRTKWLTY